MMNVAALERDLEKKQSEARSLYRKYSEQAEKENREMSDAERTEVQGILDGAKGIKATIDRIKSDQTLGTAIEELLGNQAEERAEATERARAAARRGGRQTLGQQFVSSSVFQEWSRNTRGRKGAKGPQWASPVIHLDPHGETLTTEGGSPGSGGDLIVPDYRPGILPLLFRPLRIADLIAPGTTDSNSIVYMKESLFTNAADTVIEGAVKPESTLRFDQESDNVHTIAHWLPVTEQMLEDVPAIRSYIDGRLRLGVEFAEDTKLLSGASSPDELTGILNRTGLRAAQAGGAGAAANVEAIFAQIFGIFSDSNIMPDGIVIHPTNWATIALLKDSTGQYMAGGPFNPFPRFTLWGLPVVVTSAITVGTALVGAFREASQIFRKGGIDVQATNSHSDFFIRNLVAIRAEERLALAVYRPAAFGTVTGLD